jgi:hypothetical protein
VEVPRTHSRLTSAQRELATELAQLLHDRYVLTETPSTTGPTIEIQVPADEPGAGQPVVIVGTLRDGPAGPLRGAVMVVPLLDPIVAPLLSQRGYQVAFPAAEDGSTPVVYTTATPLGP